MTTVGKRSVAREIFVASFVVCFVDFDEARDKANDKGGCRPSRVLPVATPVPGVHTRRPKPVLSMAVRDWPLTSLSLALSYLLSNSTKLATKQETKVVADLTFARELKTTSAHAPAEQKNVKMTSWRQSLSA